MIGITFILRILLLAFWVAVALIVVFVVWRVVVRSARRFVDFAVDEVTDNARWFVAKPLVFLSRLIIGKQRS